MELTLNQPTGRRKRDAAALEAEARARHFAGLPEDVSFNMAIGVINRYGRKLFRRSLASQLLDHYLNLCRGKIRKIEAFDPSDHAQDFIAFPSNRYLCAKFEVTERCIQINHRRLVEAGLISFHDRPGGARGSGYGINLLPAFTLVKQILAEEFNERMGVKMKMFLQTQFMDCHIKLMSLIDAGIFKSPETSMTLRTFADQARLWSKGKLPAEPHAKLSAFRQTIEELEAFALITQIHGEEDSPSPESGFAHITYKLSSIEKEVEAWRQEEFAVEVEALSAGPDAAADASEAPVKMRLPAPEKAVKSIRKLLHIKKMPIVDEDMDADQFLRLYGRNAISAIKLSEPAQKAIAAKYGHHALYILAFMAAHDPKVRYRAGWAAHFLRARPENGVIDVQASFYRMINDYCVESGAIN